MVFLKYKLDLLKNGNKSYLYDVLDDDLIEKIIKMVNKPNLLIIENLKFYNISFKIEKNDSRLKICNICKTKGISDCNSNPCPVKYIDPKYPNYIKDKEKRMLFIEKIKYKKVKKWNRHNNIIIDDENNLLYGKNVINYSLYDTYNKIFNKFDYKCICGLNTDLDNNKNYNFNIYYNNLHNSRMLNMIKRENPNICITIQSKIKLTLKEKQELVHKRRIENKKKRYMYICK